MARCRRSLIEAAESAGLNPSYASAFEDEDSDSEGGESDEDESDFEEVSEESISEEDE